jgi:hypothetical protein
LYRRKNITNTSSEENIERKKEKPALEKDTGFIVGGKLLVVG